MDRTWGDERERRESGPTADRQLIGRLSGRSGSLGASTAQGGPTRKLHGEPACLPTGDKVQSALLLFRLYAEVPLCVFPPPRPASTLALCERLWTGWTILAWTFNWV